jgi:hypothetical protein
MTVSGMTPEGYLETRALELSFLIQVEPTQHKTHLAVNQSGRKITVTIMEHKRL